MRAAFEELGSVAEFVNGAAFKPEDWGETGTRIIRIQNLTDRSKPFNRTTRTLSSRLHVQPGDLLVSWSASLGVFEWAGPDVALLNQHIFRVLPNERRVDKRYLRHGLELALGDMQRHLHGATMQHVNRGEFLSTKLYLPSLPEQRRIAAILDKADALRAKRRAALAQLDALRQSIFFDLFGDPSANPKEWRIVDVGSVAEVQGGLQVTSARKSLPREVPYLRVANVYRSSLDLTEIKTIRVTDAEISRTSLVKDDLLIVEGHGNPDEIGRGALWDGSIATCVHQNHLIRVRFDRTAVEPVYACAYLNSQGGRAHLLRSGKTTSGLNTITVSDVRRAPIALPAIDLQRRFVQLVARLSDSRDVWVGALTQLDALFASLQHRAFRGEL